MLGWVAVGLIVGAGAIPLGYRALVARRAAPTSPPIQVHVALGLAAAAVAFGHTMTILTSLGSPAVVSSGMAALGPAAVAFFLLVAHVGVGLRLRNPKAKERPKLRRTHLALASGIVVLVSIHVFLVTRPA